MSLDFGTVTCPDCGGHGTTRHGGKDCPRCRGAAEVLECTKCRGYGYVGTYSPCDHCDGTGAEPPPQD